MSTINVLLKNDASTSCGSWTLSYRGARTVHFDPPLENRFRVYWTFDLRDKHGMVRTLEYSQGFPGVLAPKPRFKIDYRKFVQLDWSSTGAQNPGSTEDSIQLTVTPVSVVPEYGERVFVALNQHYEFPDFMIEVVLEQEKPAYSPARIEHQAA